MLVSLVDKRNTLVNTTQRTCTHAHANTPEVRLRQLIIVFLQSLLAERQKPSMLSQELANMAVHSMNVRCHLGLLVNGTELVYPCFGLCLKLKDVMLICLRRPQQLVDLQELQPQGLDCSHF